MNREESRFSFVLRVSHMLGGCSNEQGTPTGGNTVDVVMNDAQPLPTTINIKGFNGVEYEMIAKEVAIREMTDIEKEKQSRIIILR